MAKDKELADHERAHTGKPGSKVRHGANVTGANITGRHNNDFSAKLAEMRADPIKTAAFKKYNDDFWGEKD